MEKATRQRSPEVSLPAADSPTKFQSPSPQIPPPDPIPLRIAAADAPAADRAARNGHPDSLSQRNPAAVASWPALCEIRDPPGNRDALSGPTDFVRPAEPRQKKLRQHLHNALPTPEC